MLPPVRPGTPRTRSPNPRVVVDGTRSLFARTAVPSEGVPCAGVAVGLCVLASSSAGNCSVLIRGREPMQRLTLIDAGLSPRRTTKLLAQMGFRLDQIDDVLLTHLDRDHFYPSWANALPRHAAFHIHKSHRKRAEKIGLLYRRTMIFDEQSPAELPDGITAHVACASHDQLGVAVFRFEVDGCATPILGYATDLGTVTRALTDHLQRVHTLAIESNYCPQMQVESGRPSFLVDRIMNGSGHLSNEQSAEAARAIAPSGATVLLHLSRQCNTPKLALSHHAQSSIVAHHEVPTEHIALTRCP